VLIFSTNFLFAQEQLKDEIPSQQKRYSKLRSNSSYYSRVSEVEGKLNEAKKIFKKEPEKALDLVHDGLLIAIKENYLKEEADAYELLGQFNFKLNEYSLSYKNYIKAIAIYNNLLSSTEKAMLKENYYYNDILHNIYYPTGKSAEFISDYENSIIYYNKYLKNAYSSNEIVKAKIALGNVYLKKKDLKNAEKYYKQALQIEVKEENKSGIVALNLKLGELEKEKKNNDLAIKYYRSSQNTALLINDDQAVNKAYDDISDIYESQNSIQEGIEINKEALDYNKLRNNKSEESKNSINLANFLLKQNKDQEAIQYLENSVLIAEETGDIENKSKAFKVLSEAYNKTGQESEALKKYKEYLILEDSLYKIRKKQLAEQNKKGAMLENAQNKLSLLEKDKQLNEKTIELLKQERIIQEEYINKQRFLTYSLILGILILLITSYLVYRSNKAKNKANQLLVLKSLRAQMNPHFIFNALNSVNSFISKNDERAANRYLADFSRLMRDVMENSQEDFISLTKEIDILAMYLKLENHRFKDKFDYSFEVDKDINTEEFLIPPMLIQPYIENAVWHGLRYKKEKGFLKVRIFKNKNTIIITIEDDGIGRKKSQELKTENQKILKSTGIKNIDSRLKIISNIYKAKLDVSIEDVTPTGTKVTVKIYQDNFTKEEI
jgi:tetratricopeptide (TPR) repeat protein